MKLSDRIIRREAARAWRIEARARIVPSIGAAIVSLLAALSGAFALIAIGSRLSHGVIAAIAALAALAMIAVKIARIALRVRRARIAIANARTHRERAGCPRCDAPLLARGDREVGERECGGCRAILLEGEGLIIQYASDAAIRAQRWRARVRARAGRAPAAPSPLPWTLGTIAAVASLWTLAFVSGESATAPLGLDRQASIGVASVAAIDEVPSGPPTRPRAPLWVGTEVLARIDGLLEHAAIVRVDPPEAYVVFASGSSAWVHASDLFAPALAAGDRVVIDGRSALVIARIGPALRVEQSWTSDARARVRSDAPHRDGETSEVPEHAWIEARVDGAWRPGIAVESSDAQIHVVLADGRGRWIGSRDVRAQTIGPGVSVRVDGWPRPMIVASRIGHALAVVDERGARRWTSLARVRR